MYRRSVISVKVEALVRKFLWHTVAARLPLYLVSEYPKSGGTWVSLMLAEYLGVPCPRNRFPPLASCVMHGHHLWHRSFFNAIAVFRDGRDVMVSSYFHHVIGNDRVDPRVVARNRAALALDDPSDVRSNLPQYIEYLFTRHDQSRFRFTWAEFVRSWLDLDVGVIRYERMLHTPVDEMATAIEKSLGIETDRNRLASVVSRHSFESLAGRKPGEESSKSFLRKGVAGDWKEKFSPMAREVFDRYAGEELILAGYEPDHSWSSQS